MNKINDMEELQQYRAMEEKLNGITVEQVVNGFINTVEDRTEEPYGHGRILTNEEADMWNEYRAIGTVEELKSMKENGAFTGVELAQLAAMQMRLKEYSAIGTIEEFKNLKKKSVAKKPRFYAHNYYCIECGNLVGNNEFEWQRFLYCDKCGQKLDWQ